MAEANLDSIAEDLFFKLRNRFPRIKMGDENGQTTTDPMKGRFFNFKFAYKGRNLGLITCSLIDGQSLKVYFSKEMTSKMNDAAQDQWFDLLQELRKFTMTKPALKSIDIRDIDKDQLDQKDVNFVSKYHKEKNTVQESKINWERHGRFSEGNHKSIKIHVVHKNRMDENPNNRLLAIDKIYLVNENKERFLLPFVSISGAKAMAQHVARGGTPYDNDGVTIGKAVTEMKNLSRFALSLRNKTFESEEPMKVVRASKLIKEQIKKNLHRMAGARSFEEGMEGLRGLLATESTDKTEVLKDWFTQTTYDEKIDTWLESATNALRRCMEQNLNLNEEDDSAIDIKDYSADRAANPAKIGDKLELYANPDKDDEMRALIKSQPMRGMIRLILADIATRAVDDEIAILASKADEGEFNLKHKQMIEAYLKDLYGDDPLRKEPEAKKDLYGKKKTAEEEFEEEIMAMGEDECPHCGMSPCHCDDHDHSMREEDSELDEISKDLAQRYRDSAATSDTGGMRPQKKFNRGEKYPGLAGAKIAAGSSDDSSRHALNRYKMQGGKVNVPATDEEETEEAIGDKDSRRRFSSLRKIATRLGRNEEEMEEEHFHEEEMEAGVCNHTSEGTMCPVHGMEECSGADAVTVAIGEEDKEDAMSEEFKRMLKLAGLNENYIYAAEEAEEEEEEEEVEEAAKPDFLDFDKDGDKDEPMKKALKDKEHTDEMFHYDTKKGGQGNPSQDKLGRRREGDVARHPEDYKDMVKGKGPYGKQAKDLYGINGPKGHLPEGEGSLEALMQQYGVKEGKKSKPDFLDFDKDGNKKEPMKKALKDKEQTDEALEILKKAAGIW